MVSLWYLHMQSMTQRIQNLSQNVNIISTSLAFWNGWKEVIPALYVIRFASFKLLLMVVDYCIGLASLQGLSYDGA